MRAVIALAKEPSTEDRLEAAAANETWVAHPDDSPRRSPFFAGDSRAAMVPLLAHQASTLYQINVVAVKHCSRDPISCLRKGCPLPSVVKCSLSLHLVPCVCTCQWLFLKRPCARVSNFRLSSPLRMFSVREHAEQQEPPFNQ